jgi:hypothetical protein
MTLAVHHQKFTLINMLSGVVFIPVAVLGVLFFVQNLIH